MKWRLMVNVTTPDGDWQQEYESERDSLRNARFAIGFATGYACAFGIPPEQISMRPERWIDHDDGHAGGYPHFCEWNGE
jgi:hypothetical protein